MLQSKPAAAVKGHPAVFLNDAKTDANKLVELLKILRAADIKVRILLTF